MQSKNLRTVSFFGVSLLLLAVTIALVMPSASGYEISIYDAYPGYFWVLTVGAIITGSFVIIGSMRTSGDQSWVFGLLLVLLTNALLLLLPFIRGYYYYGRSDALTHIGFVKDIISTGSFGDNIYPPIHILVLSLSEATGLDLMVVGMAVPIVFTALYFGGMYYVLTYLVDSREQILLGLPFVLVPILGRAHNELRPYEASVLLIPVILYLFFKSQRHPTLATRSVFVIALVSTLLYHPLGALFLVMIFVLYFVGQYAPRVQNRYAAPTSIASLSSAIFLVWYSNYAGVVNRFDRVYDSLFGTSEGDAPVGAYTEAAEEASPALIDIVQTAIFQYGVHFLFFSLGFLFLGLALLLALNRSYVPDSYTVMLGGTLFLFSFGGLFFLFFDLIVPHIRPWEIALIGGALLAGQLFSLLLYRVRWIRIQPTLQAGIYLLLIVAVVLVVSLSVFTVYPSPLEDDNNEQVTEMEVAGSEWITEYGNTDNGISSIEISYRRFHHAQSGLLTPRALREASTPPRFNYTRNQYLGQSYGSDTYLTVTHLGRVVYPKQFPGYRQNWQFLPSNFERLEHDSTVARIYDNGDYNQYLATTTPTESSSP
jgi:hypothetical protein